MITDIQARWSQWQADANWSASAFAELAKAAIDYGHYGLAREITEAGLAAHSNDAKLKYFQALCFSRSQAQCVPLLDALINDAESPAEVRADALALEGRLYKNQCLHSEGSARRLAAAQSAARYEQALTCASSNDQAYFFAINAASMFLLAGDSAKSNALAKQAIEFCEANGIDPEDYWKLATLGEAACLLQQPQTSQDWYQQAHAAAGDRYGNIGAMRGQLQMLSSDRDVNVLLEDVLQLPRVAAFTGHMIDYADAKPRFPAQAEPAVAAAIAATLQTQQVQFGYSSVACGADLLFAEALRQQGAETNLYLPFAQEDFLQTSVSYAGEHWQQRFYNATENATTLHYATRERYLGDVLLFEYCNRLFEGAAILRARQMATTPLLIAALRKDSLRRSGGTQATLEHWQSLGLPYEIVDIDSDEPGPVTKPVVAATEPNSEQTGNQADQQTPSRAVRTMLFADVVGFSRLSETEAPLFVQQFLGATAELLHGFAPQPEFVNTWGDGIYIVFEQLEDAAEFSLQLRDLVKTTDWEARGLPAETGIRIALHCGPVFPAVEPMTQRPNFFGSHVTRAARIEPVTVPGSVYLTEQAANLLVSSTGHGLQCDDLGQVELAKKYGAEHIFRLRRRGEWE